MNRIYTAGTHITVLVHMLLTIAGARYEDTVKWTKIARIVHVHNEGERNLEIGIIEWHSLFYIVHDMFHIDPEPRCFIAGKHMKMVMSPSGKDLLMFTSRERAEAYIKEELLPPIEASTAPM